MNEMVNTRVDISDAMDEIVALHKDFANEEWMGKEITIKTVLSVSEMLSFVTDIESAVFDDESGEYIPEAKDFFVKCAIVEYYSNIKLPEDINERYDVVYKTNIVNFIIQRLDSDAFNSMLSALNKKIEYKAQKNVEATTIRMDDALRQLENIQEKMNSLFGEMDSDTISSLASAIVNGGLDEEKLVSAVVKQRGNIK